MVEFSDQLPETVSHGKGATMTFLRNEPYMVRARMSGDPDEDVFYVPPHWHETHDEIIRVMKGKMEIRLGSSIKIYTPDDGEVFIRRGIVHSLRAFKGVECIICERTEPMDEQKEIFFRNLLAIGKFNFMDIMVTCYHGDLKPAFPGHFMWLEKLFVAVLGGYVAPLLGYRRAYESLKKAQ